METSPLHILVVNDNQEILEMISLMPGPYSYKVSTQSRVGAFIQELKQMKPDLVLRDKNPGRPDGCDLCALVKTNKYLRHIPVS